MLIGKLNILLKERVDSADSTTVRAPSTLPEMLIPAPIPTLLRANPPSKYQVSYDVASQWKYMPYQLLQMNSLGTKAIFLQNFFCNKEQQWLLNNMVQK